ncbi:hypothetical protein D3C86_1913190 [compost metagenome]
MVNGLSTQFIAVHHHAKALFTALFLGQALGGMENVSGQGLVVFAKVVEGANVLFRDHQKMHRGLGTNIVKGKHLIVFIQLACGYLPGDDLAEQTVHGTVSWPVE